MACGVIAIHTQLDRQFEESSHSKPLGQQEIQLFSIGRARATTKQQSKINETRLCLRRQSHKITTAKMLVA